MKNTWRTIAVVHVSKHLQRSGEKFHLDATAAVASVTFGQHQFSCLLKSQRTVATILLLRITRHTITKLYANVIQLLTDLLLLLLLLGDGSSFVFNLMGGG
jgi:hypothetical protein